MIGRATSGYYGHHVKKSLAIGYVKAEFAEAGTPLSIQILGRAQAGDRTARIPYDPDNLELRS